MASGSDLSAWAAWGTGSYWLNHEMGHTLGLPDLYSHNPVGGLYKVF